MPSGLGFIRETVGNAADDLRTGLQSSRQRSWLSPRDLDTRQAVGPSRGRIKETYLGGKWWRYSAGRTAGYEPEALNGDSRPGPPPDALKRAKARQARTGRSGR